MELAEKGAPGGFKCVDDVFAPGELEKLGVQAHGGIRAQGVAVLRRVVMRTVSIAASSAARRAGVEHLGDLGMGEGVSRRDLLFGQV